jgi:hypothetical protein
MLKSGHVAALAVIGLIFYGASSQPAKHEALTIEQPKPVVEDDAPKPECDAKCARIVREMKPGWQDQITLATRDLDRANAILDHATERCEAGTMSRGEITFAAKVMMIQHGTPLSEALFATVGCHFMKKG